MDPNDDAPYLIERNAKDFFGTDETYMSFWAPLKQFSTEKKLGAIVV